MYITQLHAGDWYICRYTSTKLHRSQFCRSIDKAFDTKAEAEAALSQWRDNGGIEERAW
jgi:hypothetical protein